MTKILNGSELASFIKVRQAKQVRNLRQSHKIAPRLAIVVASNSPVIATYMRLKKAYGADVLVDVEVLSVSMDEIKQTIERLNADTTTHAIIVQLPLDDPAQTETIVSLVDPKKDVDGLGSDEFFTPATALAIQWLLAGYDIALKDKKLAIIGHGRLVGAPLDRLWQRSGLSPTVFTSATENIETKLLDYDVIVTATGSPNLLTSQMVKTGAVVVDAGTASEAGRIVGDISTSLRKRTDLTMTPEKGGVGPLTVTALFDNVIEAASRFIQEK